MKIVSGGQTGADTGALEAALWCNLPHGGWCPRGRLCEDGVIPHRYHLKEMNSPLYAARTEANVVDSDATLLFTFGAPAGGSKLTEDLANKHCRPFFHVDLTQHDRTYIPELARVFFAGSEMPSGFVLNVAGSRESNFPGIGNHVMLWMIEIISHVNGTTHYPPGGKDRAIIRTNRKPQEGI